MELYQKMEEMDTLLKEKKLTIEEINQSWQELKDLLTKEIDAIYPSSIKYIHSGIAISIHKIKDSQEWKDVVKFSEHLNNENIVFDTEEELEEYAKKYKEIYGIEINTEYYEWLAIDETLNNDDQKAKDLSNYLEETQKKVNNYVK